MAVAIPAVPVLVGPVAVVLTKQAIVTDYKLIAAYLTCMYGDLPLLLTNDYADNLDCMLKRGNKKGGNGNRNGNLHRKLHRQRRL